MLYQVTAISRDWNLNKEITIYETKESAERYAEYLKNNKNVSVEIKEIEKIDYSKQNGWYDLYYLNRI